MTERGVQHVIYDYRYEKNASALLVPNIKMMNWGWETDLLYVSRANHATEYEIKCTRSDFLKDSKKVHKHQMLAAGLGPTEFYYVCPEGLIQPDEIPDYAGLMYVTKRTTGYRYLNMLSKDFDLTKIKPAKRRTLRKLTDAQVLEFLTKGVHRYWSFQQRMVA